MRFGSLVALLVGVILFGVGFANLAALGDQNGYWLLALLGVGLISGAVARGLRAPMQR